VWPITGKWISGSRGMAEAVDEKVKPNWSAAQRAARTR
jgi:hypothetical protein